MTVSESFEDLLVVIPARNEEERVPAVISRVKAAVPGAVVLVVEDTSTDQTARVAREAGALVLALPINIGYGGAMQAAHRYAVAKGVETVVTLDADGQHHPEDIPHLLEVMQESGADLVIASRFVEDTGYEASLIRRAGMVFFSVLASTLAGQKIHDTTSGFQAIGKKALDHFARSYPNDYPNAEVLVDLARRGGKIVEVPVRMSERSGGQPLFGFSSSLYYVVKMTLSVLMVLARGRRRSQ